MKSIPQLREELAALRAENQRPEGEAERIALEAEIAAELAERRRRALDARFDIVKAKASPNGRVRVERMVFGRGDQISQIIFRQWTKAEANELGNATDANREDVARSVIVSAILDSDADMSGIDPKAPDAVSVAKRKLAEYIDDVELQFSSIWGDLMTEMAEHNSAVGVKLRGKV